MSDVVLRHSKHLSQNDMVMLDPVTAMKMLNNKFIMRAGDETDSDSVIEEYFLWLRDTCEGFYHVDGPHRDQGDVKFYIYFEDAKEALLFKATF